LNHEAEVQNHEADALNHEAEVQNHEADALNHEADALNYEADVPNNKIALPLLTGRAIYIFEVSVTYFASEGPFLVCPGKRAFRSS